MSERCEAAARRGQSDTCKLLLHSPLGSRPRRLARCSVGLLIVQHDRPIMCRQHRGGAAFLGAPRVSRVFLSTCSSQQVVQRPITSVRRGSVTSAGRYLLTRTPRHKLLYPSPFWRPISTQLCQSPLALSVNQNLSAAPGVPVRCSDYCGQAGHVCH